MDLASRKKINKFNFHISFNLLNYVLYVLDIKKLKNEFKYKFAVSFSILVIVLLFRPSGIFKGKVL